jgi:hypothetical protein
MKNAVFGDVTICYSCKNRSVGETYRHHHQGNKSRRDRNFGSNIVFLHSVLRLLVSAIFGSSSPMLVAMMMELTRSSETSVLTTGTRRHITEDVILYSHRRENYKFYIALTGWAL